MNENVVNTAGARERLGKREEGIRVVLCGVRVGGLWVAGED